MNVYEAAIKRIEFIFQEFEQIVVSFSGGKDSGVMLNLVLDYAKKNNQLDKAFFTVYLPLSYPAIFAGTILAIMETLSDYGTVLYFGIETFSVGIFKSW